MAVEIKSDGSYTREIYTEVFECPDCGNTMILGGSTFCSECGQYIKWE